MFHDYNLRPMLLSEQSKIIKNSNYLYEIKFDGIRAFIYVSKSEFKILSRKGTDLTNHYPELKTIQEIIGDQQVIFDGEIIATRKGIPTFSLLQKRMRAKKVSDKLIMEIPVCFVAFDIIYDNKDVTNLPLIKRKSLLEKYNDTDYFVKSKVYHDGISLFKMVKKIGLEGIVLKLKASTYDLGKRTSNWIKVKNIKVDNFVVHGFLKKRNTYSLLLGKYKNKKLYYVGKVSVNQKHELINILCKQKKINNQFVNLAEQATYVKPIHEVRVHYLQRTKKGLLRHATLK